MRMGIVILVVSFTALTSSGEGIKVATVRSWGDPAWGELQILSELNNHWSSYGTTPLTIDTSLHTVSSFTYEDLVRTGADVLWLSDSAGGGNNFSSAEKDAIKLYVQQGHSIFGTFAVFQHPNGQDNRALAPLFGLKSDLDYVGNTGPFNSTAFNILVQSSLFGNVPNPYVSAGFPYGFVPSNDRRWDSGDLAGAQFMAKTSDNYGVITWYHTASYQAVYVSEMVEYNSYSNRADAQFLYNVFTTTPEPATILLFTLGGMILRRSR